MKKTKQFIHYAPPYMLFAGKGGNLKKSGITVLILLLISLCDSFYINAQTYLYHPTGTTSPAAVNDGTHTWDLTPETDENACKNKAGALWCDGPVDFNVPFVLKFQAKFSGIGGALGSADGICVVFGEYNAAHGGITMSSLPNSLGGSMGYYRNPWDCYDFGVDYFNNNSFAVEFDIYNNAPCYGCTSCGSPCGGVGSNYNDFDPTLSYANATHTSIQKIADPKCSGAISGPPAALLGTASLVDDFFHNYMIVWDPSTNNMRVYFDCILKINITYDFRTIFSSPYNAAHSVWGFTASTGDDCANQQVRNIVYTEGATNISGCAGTVVANADAGWATYSWHPDGEITSSINVISSGTYWVLEYDASGNYCNSKMFVADITPNPEFTVSSSPVPLCVGDDLTLTGTITGTCTGCTYQWTGPGGFSSPALVATIPAVTTANNGTYTLTVTGQGPTYCTTAHTIDVNVLTQPIAGSIIPPGPFCSGDVVNFSNVGGDLGGHWTNAGVGTIGWTTGVYNASTNGPATINYTVTNTCGTATASENIIVNKTPSITSMMSLEFCANEGMVSLLASDPGGYWTTAIGPISVNTLGQVTASAAGTAVITYMMPTGCFATVTVTADPLPEPIVGQPIICKTHSYNFSDATTGGTWSSAAPWIASVDPATGIVTGVSVGITTITYTITATGCYITTTVKVQSDPLPITGPNCVCVPNTAIYHDATPGGTWSCSPPVVATIVPTTGYLTTANAGTVTITYTVGSCYVTKLVTVNSLPKKIDGPSQVCAGSTINLNIAATGGTWSCTPWWIATINSSGVVTGIAPGVATVTYTSGCCNVTKNITVNPIPAPILPHRNTICVGDILTLTDATPGGSWASSDPGIAYVSPTGVVNGLSEGDAVITYTRLDFNCSVTKMIHVIAPLAHCVCDYVNNAGMGYPSFSEYADGNPVISATTASGNFYLNHSITVTGNVTIYNSVIVMAPGVTIKVNPGFKLTINGSHLFCCPPDMWQGIVLASDGVNPTGKLELLGNSMIEDAYTGVLVDNANTAATYTTTGSATNDLILYAHGVTFNKNWTAIKITNDVNYYSPGSITGLHPSAPYVIENTVITSRHFSNYHSGFTFYPMYPFVWPPTYGGSGGLKNLFLPASPDAPYMSHYNVDNYAAENSNVPSGANQIGIDIENTGFTLPGETVCTELYSGIAVGSDYSTYLPANTNNLNLIDTMNYGIRAINSNLICRNTSFTHLWGRKGGYGIYDVYFPCGTLGPVSKHQLNLYGLSGSSVKYTNKFWDCGTAVFARDIYNLQANYDSIFSIQSTSMLSDPQGKFGYNVASYSFCNVNISNNTMVNLRNGISFIGTAACMASLPSYLGNITMDNNTINITPSSTYTKPGAYTYKGISVQEVNLSGVSTYDISANSITQAFNGIYVSGTGDGMTVNCQSNNILLAQDITYTNTLAPQTGIQFTNIAGNNYIENNTVTGPGYNVPVPPSFSGLSYPQTTAGVIDFPIIEGIHVGGDVQNHHTDCNMVQDINTGFYLGGFSPGLWAANTMIRNAYGYVLDGVIDDQPYGYLTTSTTGNIWSNATSGTSTWVDWTGTNYQTYVVGTADATLSKMTVYSPDATQIPGNNWSDAFALYYASLSSIIGSSLLYYSCGSASSAFSASIPLQVLSSKKQLLYTQNAALKNWIAQEHTWHTLIADTTMDSNATLHSFKLMAANCRYKYHKDIEDAVATGDYSTANTLLSYPVDSLNSIDSDVVTGAVLADDTTADNVVNNHKTFYNLLLKYSTDTLTSADSAMVITLANKCPYIDGHVIYQARSLYSLIYGDLRQWSDMGCRGTIIDSMYYRRSNASNADNSLKLNQSYTLYPNPNDGNFVLQQSVVDHAPVSIEILNATGIVVYKKQIQFEGNVIKMNMNNFVPGLYLLQLRDSKGRLFEQKFVISR